MSIKIWKLLSGASFAQIILLLSLPVLSRLYTAEAFAAYGIFLAVSMFLKLGGTLRLELAVLASGSKQRAKVLLRALSDYLKAYTVLLVLGLAAVWLLFSIDVYILFVPISVLSLSLFELHSALLIKSDKVLLLSIAQSIRALCTISGQIFFSPDWAVGINGLILGAILGQVIGCLTILSVSASTNRRGSRLFLRMTKFNRIVRANQKYIRYSLPMAIIQSSAKSLPVIILSALFAPIVLGLFVMASRIVDVPAGVISTVLRSFAVAEFSGLSKGSQRKAASELEILIIVLGFFSILLCYVLGGPLFLWLLGERWLGIEFYVVALLIIFLFELLLTPTNALLLIYGEQRWLFRNRVAYAICFLSVLFFSSLYAGMLGGLTSCAVVSCVFTVTTILINKKILRDRFQV